MVFSRRSEFEAIMDMLEDTVPGLRDTSLLYEGRLSFRDFQRYFRVLVEANLVEKRGDLYVATPKGIAFIRTYQAVMNLLDTFREELGRFY